MIYGGASTFSKIHCNYHDIVDQYCYSTEGEIIKTESHRELFDTLHCSFDSIGINERWLAETITERFPFVDMVRYGCNGADATDGAIRYARSYTDKYYVFSTGYRSCQSSFASNYMYSEGCIDCGIRQFEGLNDLILGLKKLYETTHSVAAVLIEPVRLNSNVRDQLTEIRQLCTNLGIVLIFDEIITGTRVPKYCISNWFGIYPDIILLGKSCGFHGKQWDNNCAIAGKREIIKAGIPFLYLRRAVDTKQDYERI